MKKLLTAVFLILFYFNGFGQVIGRVDKNTKEFSIPPDLKTDYQVFGYQYANNTTQKMICFSSHMGEVKSNYDQCLLGAYFDTNKLKVGDKILYLGPAGSFGKMQYVSARGKKTLFYLPRSCFVIK